MAGFFIDRAAQQLMRVTLQAVTPDPMLQDTRITLFLLAELVGALQANALIPSSGSCMAASKTWEKQP